VQSVVAEGDVRITQGNRIARGARAEFDDAARTLVLSGGAVLVEGSNEIRGERVIVYLDEERSVVEGTNSRVKAVLMPHGEGGAADQHAAGEKTAGKRARDKPAGRRREGAALAGRGPATPLPGEAGEPGGPGEAGVAPDDAGTALGD
jgi:hypothetical protein